MIRCCRCGSRGSFVRLRCVDDGSIEGSTMCEFCLGDLTKMGWTPADYRLAKIHHETAQIYNARRRAEGNAS